MAKVDFYTAGEDGVYGIVISFEEGASKYQHFIEAPEDPQDAVKIADHFYQSILTGFAEAGKARNAEKDGTIQQSIPAD